jgi:hypothetical protein
VYKVGLRNKKLIIAPFMCAMQCLLNKMLALKKKVYYMLKCGHVKKREGFSLKKKIHGKKWVSSKFYRVI